MAVNNSPFEVGKFNESSAVSIKRHKRDSPTDAMAPASRSLWYLKLTGKHQMHSWQSEENLNTDQNWTVPRCKQNLERFGYYPWITVYWPNEWKGNICQPDFQTSRGLRTVCITELKETDRMSNSLHCYVTMNGWFMTGRKCWKTSSLKTHWVLPTSSPKQTVQ